MCRVNQSRGQYLSSIKIWSKSTFITLLSLELFYTELIKTDKSIQTKALCYEPQRTKFRVGLLQILILIFYP